MEPLTAYIAGAILRAAARNSYAAGDAAIWLMDMADRALKAPASVQIHGQAYCPTCGGRKELEDLREQYGKLLLLSRLLEARLAEYDLLPYNAPIEEGDTRGEAQAESPSTSETV